MFTVVVTIGGVVWLQSIGSGHSGGSSGQPTFRTGTTLVEVSAIVTADKRPVTNLRREEVTVLDNGKPQPLTAFEFVDLGAIQGPEQRRDFVLVLDDLHIDPRRTQPAIDAALAFVDALGPHDRLAIVRTGPPDSRFDFTTEREPARAQIRRFRGQSTAGPAIPGETEYRSRMALDVIGQVAAALRDDASERRAVLLVSEGHPGFLEEPSTSAGRESQDVYLEFLAVLRQAALANVAIYTVDPRGLRASMLTSDLMGSLAALALNTGGIQTRWTNEITANFQRILQDSRQYYRLAYVQPDVPPGKKQPRSRSIKVKVSRPGVEVRARKMYAPIGN